MTVDVTSVSIPEAQFSQSDSLRLEPSQNFLDKLIWYVDKVFTVVKPDQHACDATKLAVYINSHFGQERVLG